MNIFSALLLLTALLLQLGVVTGGKGKADDGDGAFATEDVVPNDPPLMSKSAKASSDDDIDYDEDEVADLIDTMGGATGALSIVDASDELIADQQVFRKTRKLAEEPSLRETLSEITCENNQNKTILAAVTTEQMTNFLNATISCYTPPTRFTDGNTLKCFAIAKTFDAAINLDGCVSTLEILKQTVQLKKIQREKKQAAGAA